VVLAAFQADDPTFWMLRLLRVFLAIGFLHVMFEIRRLDRMLESKKKPPRRMA
jgi:hypothetical protein